MNRQAIIATILAALIVLALVSRSAEAATPTNTPVLNGPATWTPVVYPTSTRPTNTPVPIIGEPWPPPHYVWITSVMQEQR